MKRPRAEFFDIFGVFTFSIISGIAIWGLNTGEALPKWVFWFLLFVGIAGLIIDSSTVSQTYLARKKPQERQ